MNDYPVIQLPDDACAEVEQLGAKFKFWFWGGNDQRFLFKQGRPGTGENWSEKAACEICSLLGLPHAHYDLAKWQVRNGVITPIFVPQGGHLVHGNELLARIIPGYQSTADYREKQHTVIALLAITKPQRINFPLGWPHPEELNVAADVVVGYLMFDCLIANTDRHHENWGFVVTSEKEITLAPTYDHASSLGRNESDEARSERLTTRDKGRSVETFAKRARSELFGHPSDTRTLSTLDAFQEAAKFRPDAADFWRTRLMSLTDDKIREVFDRIPKTVISDIAVEFACRLITVNRSRILESAS